ncbi:hypothetical protein F5B22DRAFT_618961 [Xylaria bambusicola]|uniref:uncharacterized protein n=1 Tax=Xylaria bambusicola TaxID=326684 RepID=UPI0020080F52|nr:uncharacterized protein F5B22DRAFT_618961 [Xylaria bambusicola]KAI0508851.1 hypothetical protein F5B22DRAFT_618961 [Xylaria bambusicola]
MSDESYGSTFSGNPFIINYLYWTNITCSDLADPDQAGLGILVSSIIAALTTIILSLSRSQQQPHWTDQVILSFSDQQLITGFALLLSSYVNLYAYKEDFVIEDALDYQDAHFVLVVYLGCLSSSSHLICLLRWAQLCEVEEPGHTKVEEMMQVRKWIILIFALFLTGSAATSYHTFRPIFWLLQGAPGPGSDDIVYAESWLIAQRVIPAFLILYVFWICYMQVSSELKEKLEKALSHVENCLKKTLPTKQTKRVMCLIQFCLFSRPKFALGIQTFGVIISILFVLLQKFSQPPEITDYALELGIQEWCGLNNPGDNRWGFGQTVAVAMLVLPFLSLIDAYKGRRGPALSFSPSFYYEQSASSEDTNIQLGWW